MRHHRRSIRLTGYDYSTQGAYCVTICTHDRQCTLGNVVSGEMVLSETGRIADEGWLAIPNDFPNVTLDEYQVMPNHLHGIVVIWANNVRDLIDDSVRGLNGKGNTVGDLMRSGNSARDLVGEDRTVGDLDGDGHSVRDLINQIPPGDQIPPCN